MISRRFVTLLPLGLLMLFMSMPLPGSALSSQAGSDNNFIAALEIPDIDVDQDGSENIFDLLELLQILCGDKPATEYSDVNKDGSTNIFDLITILQVLSGSYDTYLIKGQHLDNDTEQGAKALITINGKEYYTDINGKFSKRLTKEFEYLITARQIDEDGNFVSFKRTRTIPGRDIDTLKIYSVSNPTQEGVTPEIFRDFCWEANFWPTNYLKTMFGNPDGEYWISSHGDSATASEGGVATAEDQAYAKSLIENEIYPNVKPENRFPIYIEDPNNPETIPFKQDGTNVTIPRNHPSFGIGTGDDNMDGIIDWNIIYFPTGQWNEKYKARMLEEFLSALIGTGQVTNFSGLTALQAKGIITEIDTKLLNICQRYKPKIPIEDILGM